MYVQCLDNGTVETYECPTPPAIIIEGGNIALRLFFVLINAVGAHGIVGFLGGVLLILGFVKLMFGGICCCRKTKAQKYYDKQIKKGVNPKGKCEFLHRIIFAILVCV